MRVVWSPRALERATEIAVHIASEWPSAAGAWVDELFANVADLRHHPRRGRRVPEAGRATIREVMHGSYRVISRLDPTRMVVLTVRHGRRTWTLAKSKPPSRLRRYRPLRYNPELKPMVHASV